ncbi:IclR family transcriptional regulator [Natrialbaceae archaeon A-chndr2]
MGKRNRKNRVATTETVFLIIETLQSMEGARVSEVAEELDLAKSTIHRHLMTLKERGYVVKEGDEYHPGLRFLDIGQYARQRKEAYLMAKPKVEAIAEKTGERTQFMVEENGRAVYVHIVHGENAVLTDPGIGNGIPLHATSAGKSILAHLPKWKVSKMLEKQPLSKETSATITDPDELRENLKEIRERGYSFNEQENLHGLRAVGVPVRGSAGDVIGALSVSGPTHRMKGSFFREELPNLLLGTVNELELNIAHS